MKLALYSLFIFAFSLGFWGAQKSWDGVRFVSVGSTRHPAAFQGLRDFSNLRGISLLSAAEFQLSNQSEVRRSEAGIEILFNQFVMRDSEGLKNFVCRVEGRPGVFDQIEVSFRGTGISEAGKVPRLTVLAECFSSPSALKVGAIRVFIPMKEITELRPIDQEVKLQGAQIKITQMVSEWPLDWVIDGINYLNSTSNSSKLSLEMKKGEGPASKALSFSWPIRSFEPTPRKF